MLLEHVAKGHMSMGCSGIRHPVMDCCFFHTLWLSPQGSWLCSFHPLRQLETESGTGFQRSEPFKVTGGRDASKLLSPGP